MNIFSTPSIYLFNFSCKTYTYYLVQLHIIHTTYNISKIHCCVIVNKNTDYIKTATNVTEGRQ